MVRINHFFTFWVIKIQDHDLLIYFNIPLCNNNLLMLRLINYRLNFIFPTIRWFNLENLENLFCYYYKKNLLVIITWNMSFVKY